MNFAKKSAGVFILFIAVLPLFLIINYSFLNENPVTKLRSPVDTVGFAHTRVQMDSVMSRIERGVYPEQEKIFTEKNISGKTSWRVVICPHDDYSYAGEVYTYALKNIRAKTVLIFGVAHKARNFNLENKIIFDHFTHWHGCYGNVKISDAREEIIKELPENIFLINDSMQQIEHSVEAIVPFLQFYNRDVEIISILVPHMSFGRMKEISKPLSEAINKILQKRNWHWGNDFAMVISNDCVHYGDEGWNGRNFARYGCDSSGYKNAIAFERQLISECLDKTIVSEKIKSFTAHTVMDADFREYKWTWCGRYSVPFGLLTSLNMAGDTGLSGSFLCYKNSIDHEPIRVHDLGLGVTALANLHHWVGYTAIGYE